MKKLLIPALLLSILLTACARPLKAIYLVRGQGQLAAEDLKRHPEVAVVHTFADLKHLARAKTALWIDKDVVDLVDGEWLDQAPQRRYPLVVVGYSHALYAFREALPGHRVIGPYVDWSKETVEPGFSIWMIREETDTSRSAYMGGYEGTPTVQDILGKTNLLLEGKPID